MRGNTHRVKIDEDLLWLWPYFIYAKRFGVPIWRISLLVGYTVPKGLEKHQEASIIFLSNKKFRINLCKRKGLMKAIQHEGSPVETWMGRKYAHFFEHTVESLAHELSHILYWRHGAERWECEKRLEVAFARLAKRRGYCGYD